MGAGPTPAEWASDRDYTARVANLCGTGTDPRANGDVYLRAGGPGATVSDDDDADVPRVQRPRYFAGYRCPAPRGG